MRRVELGFEGITGRDPVKTGARHADFARAGGRAEPERELSGPIYNYANVWAADTSPYL